jgi:tRNA dimethylallyltransferase
MSNKSSISPKIPDTKYQIQNTNKILIILGPTSSGKSDIAIKLAKKFNGEIISADSRQIFRGMDIGTGKITRDKKSLALRNSESCARGRKKPSFDSREAYYSQGVPHYMIDIISPCTDFNVAKFKKKAEKIIGDILKRGKLPIICGGTGFWIQAIADDVNFPEVKPDWQLREKLEKYSTEKLFLMLKKLDSSRTKTIDAKNKVRLIRAIEICKKIGRVPSIKNTKCQLRNTRYQALQIGLNLSREKLYENIEKRVLSRFKQGMIEEVKNLHSKQKLSWKKIQSFGLAYFWIPLYLQNKITKKELFEKVIQVEKNYAKRQMTWFKRDKQIKWLENYMKIEKAAKNFLK